MMITQRSQAFAKTSLVLGAAFFSVLVGFAISIQSELTLLVLALIGGGIFFFKFPNWGLIAFLLISFYIPAYTKIDFTAAIIFAIAIIYLFVGKHWDVLKNKEILRPLLFIATIVIISTLAGILLGKNRIEDIYRDGRVFLYWLVLIPLATWTPKKNSATWLADSMLLIGFVVCGLAIVQGATGKRLVDTGLVADLDTMSTQSMSTVRVQIPGFMFAMYSISYVTALLLGRVRYARSIRIPFKSIPVTIPLLPLFCILSLGIVFNFGRALWFWTFFSLILVAIQYGVRGLLRFLMWVAIPVVLGLAVLAAVKPDMLETIGTRISSVAEEGGVGSSFGWRELEMQEGLKSLESTALLGVGMGGKYRRFNEMLANFPDHTIYTHNGWLYLTLKLSIFGLLAYLWLGYRVVQTIKKSPKRNPNEQAIAAASIAFTIAFLGINFTQPEIMSHYGLLTFVFICAIALFLNKQARSASPEEDHPHTLGSQDFLDTVPSRLAAV